MPAHLAAKKGNTDTLAALIAAGANVNAVKTVVEIQLRSSVCIRLFFVLFSFVFFFYFSIFAFIYLYISIYLLFFLYLFCFIL